MLILLSTRQRSRIQASVFVAAMTLSNVDDRHDVGIIEINGISYIRNFLQSLTSVNMHENKVQTCLALSVKELDNKNKFS